MHARAAKAILTVGVSGLMSAFAAARVTTLYVNGTCGDDSWSGLTPACQAPDGPKKTIQAGIDAAVAGDTVLVAAGEYFENTDFLGKDITLASIDGPDVTIINGRDIDSCVHFLNGETSAAVLTGFTLTHGKGHNNGSVRLGGGVVCYGTSPTIVGNKFIDNWAEQGGGIEAEQGGRPIIVRNLFTGNFADSDHVGLHLSGVGGAMSIFNASAVIRNNVMIRNTAELWGGAISVLGRGIIIQPVIVDCENNLIVENWAYSLGGGVFFERRGTMRIEGCTLSRNRADVSGEGIVMALGDQTLTIINTILDDNGSDEFPEIVLNGGTAGVSYCDLRGGQAAVLVNGGTLNWGAGNIDVDPMFVDPPRDDYHLDVCSPLVNAGDPAFVPDADDADIDDQPRVLVARVDIGADEVPHSDANGNGIPDACECDACDANCDGEINAFDIEPFIDVLFNGAKPCSPCAADADGNGSRDAFDIEPFVDCLFG